MIASRSRKVRGYVKAVLRLEGLRRRLQAQEERLEPLRRKARIQRADVLSREKRLTGGQVAEAERLLKAERERRPA